MRFWKYISNIHRGSKERNFQFQSYNSFCDSFVRFGVIRKKLLVHFNLDIPHGLPHLQAPQLNQILPIVLLCNVRVCVCVCNLSKILCDVVGFHLGVSRINHARDSASSVKRKCHIDE